MQKKSCENCMWINCKDYGKPIYPCHEWFDKDLGRKLSESLKSK